MKLLYDTELRRPACILLQAIAGGDRQGLYRYFRSEQWLTEPTPGMRMVEGPPEEWERVGKLEAMEGQ